MPGWSRSLYPCVRILAWPLIFLPRGQSIRSGGQRFRRGGHSFRSGGQGFSETLDGALKGENVVYPSMVVFTPNDGDLDLFVAKKGKGPGQ